MTKPHSLVLSVSAPKVAPMSLIRRTPTSVAGPFTGQHVPCPSPVVPPEWNMRRGDYNSAVTAETKPGLRFLVTSTSVSAVAGGAMWPLALAPGTMPEWAQPIVFLSGLTHGFGLLFSAFEVRDRSKWKHHDKSVLAHKDPALVIDVSGLPHDVRGILISLTDVPADSKTRQQQLRRAYEFAQTFTNACTDADDWSMRTLIRNCPDELDELVRYTINATSRSFTEPAARIQSHITALATKHVSARDLNAALIQPATDPPGSGVASGSLRVRWDDALTAHDRVVDAWTDIICNPLAALEHSTLLDVTQPRTATFIETYGDVQDLRALHGQTFPVGDEAAAKEYLSAVRKACEAWDEAVRHSKHVGFDWLPDTEAAHARKAAALLVTANDEGATTSERATAANMASERLSKVKSFLLPALALHELETRKRLELGVPSTMSA